MARASQQVAPGGFRYSVLLVTLPFVACSLERSPLDIPDVDRVVGGAAGSGGGAEGSPGDAVVRRSRDAGKSDPSETALVRDGGEANATEASPGSVAQAEGGMQLPGDATVPGEPMPLDDAMVPGDAMVAPRPDGGAPGSIACAPSTVCQLPENYCCRCSDGPTCFLPGSCWPALAPCVGQAILCDDAADCGGAKCCAHFTGNLFFGATCERFCSADGDVQLCVTDQECTAPATCKPLDSLPPFSACQ